MIDKIIVKDLDIFKSCYNISLVDFSKNQI